MFLAGMIAGAASVAHTQPTRTPAEAEPAAEETYTIKEAPRGKWPTNASVCWIMVVNENPFTGVGEIRGFSCEGKR
jgi:hypothetical protein